MYHPPSKRKQLIQRVVVYTLMAVSVVLLVAILVFYMLGWQFNRADGRIEQGGLVQFSSQPSGASVILDGNDLGIRTSSKSTLTAGQHTVTMQRNGYNDWRKSIEVVPGTILWLNYVRLIPRELPVEQVADFETISDTSVSPDDRWLAIMESPTAPAIRLADLSNNEVKLATLELPASVVTSPKDSASQSFQLGSWDDDSRYMIVRHNYDNGKTEWLVVDTRDADNTKNVTQLLGVSISKLMFSSSNAQRLYAQVDGDVRQINLQNATLSRPLVANVAEFSLTDSDTLVYSTRLDPETKQRSVGYYTNGADKARALRTYGDDSRAPLHITIDSYFDDTYVSIAYGDHIEILTGDLPSSQSNAIGSLDIVATVSAPDGVDYLSTHTDGRFVIAQKGASFTVYDLELKRLTTTELKGTTKVSAKLDWLDNYMLWSDRDGQLRLYEFDGANQHTIMPVERGYTVTLSPNDKYLYAISKADGRLHLARVQLILN